jgi:hypothetical protein
MNETPEPIAAALFALLDALQPVDTAFCRALSDADLRMLWRELDTAHLFCRMKRTRREATEGESR